ncbi:MAG: hypothetical protein IJH84_10605 [Saccharopolyspora sp.]|uniref:hypothetical protein n=1 Tax=Saccharopolyspora TaxID=1835 RepID=UPI00190937EB|nr:MULTISPECIES: hypothetical protein [unclassified Saccharopolyspora]MBK0870292.1 hypothetical protein [Saccharopolyspora sp. HNM0986]MBQ6641466.1 hypothetical protein [Saccharopolyspora sp.]
MRRFVILSALGSAAALGYAGVRRLGRWLDAPIAPEPAVNEPGSGARERRAPEQRVIR